MRITGGSATLNGGDREEQSDALTELQEFASLDLGAAALRSPTEVPTLAASRTLGISQANAMIESRPTCMVGIVGLPGAGCRKDGMSCQRIFVVSQGAIRGVQFCG